MTEEQVRVLREIRDELRRAAAERPGGRELVRPGA